MALYGFGACETLQPLLPLTAKLMFAVSKCPPQMQICWLLAQPIIGFTCMTFGRQATSLAYASNVDVICVCSEYALEQHTEPSMWEYVCYGLHCYREQISTSHFIKILNSLIINSPNLLFALHEFPDTLIASATLQMEIPLAVIGGHKKAVSYVRFLGGDRLVSASTDNKLKLWDIKDITSSHQSPSEPLMTFSGQLFALHTLQGCPLRRTLILATTSWNLSQWSFIQVIFREAQHCFLLWLCLILQHATPEDLSCYPTPLAW